MVENLSKKQIEFFKNVFKTVDKVNNLIRSIGDNTTEAEFHDMLNKVSNDDGNSFDFSQDEYRNVFKVFDKDGDGFLTIDELKTVLSYTGDGFTEEQINLLVERIATSSDGKINYETFVVVMSTDINECEKDSSTTSSEDQ